MLSSIKNKKNKIISLDVVCAVISTANTPKCSQDKSGLAGTAETICLCILCDEIQHSEDVFSCEKKVSWTKI